MLENLSNYLDSIGYVYKTRPAEGVNGDFTIGGNHGELLLVAQTAKEMYESIINNCHNGNLTHEVTIEMLVALETDLIMERHSGYSQNELNRMEAELGDDYGRFIALRSNP